MEGKTVDNIFKRMSAITAELQTVAKNMTVGTGKNTYKAVSERDILDAVKPVEEKHGVYSYPAYREVIESNLLESDSQYGKKTTLMTRIKTIYRFVNIDNPDDYIETVVFSEGMDAQDKGSGKAMTYADKYALMKAYKISTGDDPDQKASESENYKKAGISARDMFIAKLKEKGIDAKKYAEEKGLKGAISDERYYQLIKELG